MRPDPRPSPPMPTPPHGTGLCPEAQADGVPCCELGRDCETCSRAVRLEEPAPTPRR